MVIVAQIGDVTVTWAGVRRIFPIFAELFPGDVLSIWFKRTCINTHATYYQIRPMIMKGVGHDKHVLPSSGYTWPPTAEACPLHIMSELTNPTGSLWFGGLQQSVEQPDFKFNIPEPVLWLMLFAH